MTRGATTAARQRDGQGEQETAARSPAEPLVALHVRDDGTAIVALAAPHACGRCERMAAIGVVVLEGNRNLFLCVECLEREESR